MLHSIGVNLSIFNVTQKKETTPKLTYITYRPFQMFLSREITLLKLKSTITFYKNIVSQNKNEQRIGSFKESTSSLY